MKVIPAIDIKGGQCVRLYQGQMDQETVYSDNPLEVARRWEEAGAEMLHVVDLDGAVEGAPVNSDIICQIISSLKIPVQVGGGIRESNSAGKYLDTGAARVVLGTAAVSYTGLVHLLAEAFPGKLVLSLDASEGMVAIRGWQEVTNMSAVDVAKRFEDSGVSAIVFTDIKRDGTLAGPNIESIEKLSKNVKIPVIASGGISGVKDIAALLTINNPELEGVIVGKALYSGAIDLREAIALTKSK